MGFINLFRNEAEVTWLVKSGEFELLYEQSHGSEFLVKKNECRIIQDMRTLFR